jgi:hypothetical protein
MPAANPRLPSADAGGRRGRGWTAPARAAVEREGVMAEGVSPTRRQPRPFRCVPLRGPDLRLDVLHRPIRPFLLLRVFRLRPLRCTCARQRAMTVSSPWRRCAGQLTPVVLSAVVLHQGRATPPLGPRRNRAGPSCPLSLAAYSQPPFAAPTPWPVTRRGGRSVRAAASRPRLSARAQNLPGNSWIALYEGTKRSVVSVVPDGG